MVRLARIAAAVLVVAAGGQDSVWAQGGKTTTYPVVKLSVGVEASVDHDAPGIWGDGALYENGAADGTTANIDKYGNLIIKFGRPVTFNYGEEQVLEIVSGAYDNSYISTLNAGGTALQNLAANTSQCIKLNWQYDIAGGWLRHGFNRSFDQHAHDTASSYAVVTRTDGSEWVVQPSTGLFCGNYENPDSIARVFSQVSVRGKWQIKEFGLYSLPFRLVLTRQ